MGKPILDSRRLALDIRAGDTEAVGSALIRMSQCIVSHYVKTLPPGLDIDDVIADALVALWSKLPEANLDVEPSALFAFLASIVNYSMMTSVKRHKRYSQRLEPLEALDD